MLNFSIFNIGGLVGKFFWGLIGSGLVASASATVLVQYNFDRVSNLELDYSATTVAGLSANDFHDTSGATGAVSNTIDSGSSSSSLTSFFNSVSGVFNDSLVLWQNGGMSTGVGSDMPDAIANNQFIHFTMTADNVASYADLTSLTFDAVRSANNGVIDLAVRSSLDGFASDLTLDSSTIASSSTGFTTHTVDLSSADFDSVNSVEFRIYFDNRQADGNGGSGTSFDNIIVNGEFTQVPEPSSLLLLGAGVFSLIIRRTPR